MIDILWGVPIPTFGRLRHGFVNNRSLCGKFENQLPQFIEQKSVCVCQTCRNAADKLSINDRKNDHG